MGVYKSGKIESKDRKTVVYFIVNGEEIVDMSSASYQPLTDNTLGKQILQKAARVTGYTELATRYQGITPKTLSFNITWNASRQGSKAPYASGQSAKDIQSNIMKLQSFCYPDSVLGGNPQMARLVIGRLYNIYVLITSVQVTWSGIWRNDLGMPLHSQVAISCEQFSYPTRTKVLAGAGFYNERKFGQGQE